MVIIGILAAIAIPKFASTKEQAVVANMKSDLRNLISAQEGYFYENSTYYGGAVPDGTGAFKSTTNVTIVLSNATGTGWSAEASHPNTVRKCYVYYGNWRASWTGRRRRPGRLYLIWRTEPERHRRAPLVLRLARFAPSCSSAWGSSPRRRSCSSASPPSWSWGATSVKPSGHWWRSGSAALRCSCSSAAYVVHRLVIRPLEILAAEADVLAAGDSPGMPIAYETARDR